MRRVAPPRFSTSSTGSLAIRHVRRAHTVHRSCCLGLASESDPPAASALRSPPSRSAPAPSSLRPPAANTGESWKGSNETGVRTCENVQFMRCTLSDGSVHIQLQNTTCRAHARNDTPIAAGRALTPGRKHRKNDTCHPTYTPDTIQLWCFLLVAVLRVHRRVLVQHVQAHPLAL